MVDFGSTAVSQPQWSPDGKWVVVHQGRRDACCRTSTSSRRPAARNAHHRPRQLQRHQRPVDARRQDRSSTCPAWTSATSGRRTAITRRRFTASRWCREERPATDKASTARPKPRRTDQPASAGVAARQNGERPSGAAAARQGRGENRLRPSRPAHAQMTRSGDTIGGMAVSPDGRSVVFVTSGVEGGRPVKSIWSVSLDGEQVDAASTQSGVRRPMSERRRRLRSAAASAAGTPACNSPRTAGRSTIARAAASTPCRSAAAAPSTGGAAAAAAMAGRGGGRRGGRGRCIRPAPTPPVPALRRRIDFTAQGRDRSRRSPQAGLRRELAGDEDTASTTPPCTASTGTR